MVLSDLAFLLGSYGAQYVTSVPSSWYMVFITLDLYVWCPSVLKKTDFLVDVCVHEQSESSVGVCSLVKRFEVEVYDVVGNEVDEDNKIVVVMKRLWFYWSFLIRVPLLPNGDGEVPIEVAHHNTSLFQKKKQ